MKDNVEYVPLAVDDGDETRTVDEVGRLREGDHPGLRLLVVVTLIVSLLCSAVSLIFLVLNARTQWQLHNMMGGLVMHGETHNERPDPGLLERPSTYVGLDKLSPELQHSALPQTLDVFPPFFQPVDHVHPHYVFPSDEHARFTFNGRVSPGDRRVLLTDHVCLFSHLVFSQLTKYSGNDGCSIPGS